MLHVAPFLLSRLFTECEGWRETVKRVKLFCVRVCFHFLHFTDVCVKESVCVCVCVGGLQHKVQCYNWKCEFPLCYVMDIIMLSFMFMDPVPSQRIFLKTIAVFVYFIFLGGSGRGERKNSCSHSLFLFIGFKSQRSSHSSG